MLYVIIAQDEKDSVKKRPVYREEHLKRLDVLYKQNKLIMAGPFTDITGSLIVVDLESYDEAKKFIESDPFYINGIYKSYEIKPFKLVYPKDSL